MMFRALTQSEEAKFRTWARSHYTPGEDIQGHWHPVVQNECAAINKEVAVFVADEPEEVA